VALSGHYAYVADWDAGLQIIDVSNASNPQRIGGHDTSGSAVGVTISGDYAYVLSTIGKWPMAYDVGLQVIDVSNPANPRRVGGYNTGFHGPLDSFARGVVVSGNYAYVADDSAGLQVIDVSNPANPRRVGGNSSVGVALSVFVSGNHAFIPYRFVVNGEIMNYGLDILNLYTPMSLTVAPAPQTGIFGVSVQGLAGVQVDIERSQDLIRWQKWTNGVLANTPLTFRDGDTNPRQFYRTLTR
jgi:hypothetical protein